MNYIKGYRIPFTEKPVQDRVIQKIFTKEEKILLRIEIDKLLNKGAIEECSHSENEFISPYFLVPKPDGTNRFIFNLKKLNQFIQPPHFKLEDMRSVLNLVSKNDFMVSVDLKDAYYVVPIHHEHRKFLRFIFEEKLFQFTCLPFGLCTSPYIFTKILKPVVNKLRSKGMLSIVYLDDFLITENSKAVCKKKAQQAVKFLQRLGFIINFEKSVLQPSQECKYLGFVINSVNYTLGLPDKKKKQIVEFSSKWENGMSYRIREFAEFLGVLTAACPAVAYGFIHCKRLEREKFLALKFNGGNYDAKIRINTKMVEDFEWWKTNAAIGINPIRNQNFCIEIFSDASMTGWGSYCNKKYSSGFWNKEERKKHINFLELLAAFFALKSFASELTDCEVLLRLDNNTAIAYINRAGGVQYPHLSELSRKIWEWCERRKMWLKASYISSAENIDADKASRESNIDGEWELSQFAFRQIENQFGKFAIDLFASRLNKKCKKFYSRFPDPEAEKVDAFTVSWKLEYFYAFPPFALILRVLRKIINDEATGVLVVPAWFSQPWYPLFTSCLIEPTITFHPSNSLLVSPCREKIHPLSSHLSLVVGKLSGKHFRGKESTKKLSML